MTKVRKKLSRRSSKLSGWVWMIIGGFSGLLIASIIPKNTKNIILIDIPTEKKEATKLNQTIKPDQIITNRFSFYEIPLLGIYLIFFVFSIPRCFDFIILEFRNPPLLGNFQ